MHGADDRWSALRIDDVEPVTVADGLQWRPLRRVLGVEAFGVNAYVARSAGDHVVEEHTEQKLGHEEIYVVLTGRATFTLDGDAVDAPAGTVVHIRDPRVRRGATADEPGTSVLAVGGKPGEAYTPSAWEWYFYAERFRGAENWAGAVDELKRGLELHPDNSGMLYSLACFEALDGRTEVALAHLREAVELDPDVARFAQTDHDLDSIRTLPGFPAAPAVPADPELDA